VRVVALMCRFGCDALFEHGDVFAVNLTIHAHPRVTGDAAVRDVLEGLVGRTCPAYADQSVYFDWHAARHRPSL